MPRSIGGNRRVTGSPAGRPGRAQGDAGHTDLLGRRRVPKYHPIVEALGLLDEANSALGAARRAARLDASQRFIHQAQQDLYELMAELGLPPDHPRSIRLLDAHVAWLDRWLSSLLERVAPTKKFLLPGASDASAPLDVARACVRSAERALARLLHEGDLRNAFSLTYVNRLSLVLFYLARAEDAAAGVDPDIAAAQDERPEP